MPFDAVLDANSVKQLLRGSFTCEVRQIIVKKLTGEIVIETDQ